MIQDGSLLVELGPDTSPPGTAIARDETLAAQVAAGERPSTIRIWTNRRALVAPRWQLRGNEGHELLDRLGNAWPLCGRGSGGAVVAHGPGTLNMSLVVPARSSTTPSIDEAYGTWFDLLAEALRDAYGIQAAASKVDGAFCNGRYDAAVSGRKLAGTAQMRRRGSVVVHGTILVDVVATDYVELVSRAERVCGSMTRAYDARRIISLSELTRGQGGLEGLADALAQTSSRVAALTHE